MSGLYKNKLTDNDRQKIYELIILGNSLVKIAEMFGIDKKTVYYYRDPNHLKSKNKKGLAKNKDNMKKKYLDYMSDNAEFKRSLKKEKKYEEYLKEEESRKEKVCLIKFKKRKYEGFTSNKKMF